MKTTLADGIRGKANAVTPQEGGKLTDWVKAIHDGDDPYLLLRLT